MTETDKNRARIMQHVLSKHKPVIKKIISDTVNILIIRSVRFFDIAADLVRDLVRGGVELMRAAVIGK